MKATIFIDGECGICKGFAAFVVTRDTARYFKIDILQGDVAKKVIPDSILNPMNTVVLLEDAQIWIKYEAVRRILERLGGKWWFLSGMMRFFPRFLGDFGYDFVAKNRGKLFGKGRCKV